MGGLEIAQINISEKTLKLIFIIIILGFILYKAYLPLYDAVFEITDKKPNEENYNQPETTFDKVKISYEILEGENSFLITGYLKENCESVTEKDYCPVWLRKLEISDTMPIINDDSFGIVKNKMYTKRERINFLLPIKKTGAELVLNATFDYKPLDSEYAKLNNYPPVVRHEQSEILEGKKSAKEFDSEVFAFRLQINDRDLLIDIEGETSSVLPEVKLIASNVLISKNMIFFEEEIEIINNKFNETLQINDTLFREFPVSVVLLIKSENYFYAIKKIVEKDSIRTITYD